MASGEWETKVGLQRYNKEVLAAFVSQGSNFMAPLICTRNA